MRESLFCRIVRQKNIYISRRVDCDTSQDQLVLGSCIVRIIIGYDLIVLIFNGYAANTHEVGGVIL